MTERRSGLPVLAFAHFAALESWFASQPSDSLGVWIKLAKKAAPRATLTKAEAIDAALCHGWIDGRLEKYDDMHWLVRFTPRRSGSKWSLRNRKRAIELMEQGRMRSAGLAQIEAATADGRWDKAYAPASSARVPCDLQSALYENPTAADRHEQAPWRLGVAACCEPHLCAQAPKPTMHRPSVVKTPTVKTASIMLPSTESGLPLDGRRPKYSQSLAVQMAIITLDQKFVRALPLSHSSAP